MKFSVYTWKGLVTADSLSLDELEQSYPGQGLRQWAGRADIGNKIKVHEMGYAMRVE